MPFLKPLSMGLLVLLIAASCGKKQELPEEGGAPAPSRDDTPLAYQESVRAGMDNLELKMSFQGEDGEREEWEGRITIVKDRFATVEHVNSQRKKVHLRRWANVHIAEIPASGEPRANRTEESPLTGELLVADRLPTGGWNHRLAEEGALAKEKPASLDDLLGELDNVERSAAAFYPDEELEVGESWQVPATAMARWFGDEVDGFSGDITLVVDRMETLQGQSCAVLTVSFKTTGKMRDPDGQTLDMTLEGAGEIWRATALGEDLKVEIKGTVTLKTAVEERDIELTISGPLVISEERTLKS